MFPKGNHRTRGETFSDNGISTETNANRLLHKLLQDPVKFYSNLRETIRRVVLFMRRNELQAVQTNRDQCPRKLPFPSEPKGRLAAESTILTGYFDGVRFSAR